jgi:hypothetical protein
VREDRYFALRSRVSGHWDGLHWIQHEKLPRVALTASLDAQGASRTLKRPQNSPRTTPEQTLSSATACDCLRLPATFYDCRCLTADACCLLLPDAINCGLLLLLSRLLISRRLSRSCSTRTEILSSSWAQNWVLKTPLKVPSSDMAYTVARCM